MTITASVTKIFRGATVRLRTQFFDFDGNAANPDAAVIAIVYTDPNGVRLTATLGLSAPPPGGFQWTAVWDSRGAGLGVVSCSVHSVEPAVPFAVEDFSFVLTANPANQVTF